MKIIQNLQQICQIIKYLQNNIVEIYSFKQQNQCYYGKEWEMIYVLCLVNKLHFLDKTKKNKFING